MVVGEGCCDKRKTLTVRATVESRSGHAGLVLPPDKGLPHPLVGHGGGEAAGTGAQVEEHSRSDGRDTTQ